MQTANFFLRKIQICMPHFASSSRGILDLRGRLPLSSERGSSDPSFTSGVLQKRVGKPRLWVGGVLLLTGEAGTGALGFLGVDHCDCGKVPCLMGSPSRDMQGGFLSIQLARGGHSGVFLCE